MVVVVAIGSRNLDRARRVAADLNISRAYEGYERVLDDPEVQVCLYSTPEQSAL